MNDSYILGSKHLIDCLFLCRIQIGEMHGLKRKGLRFLTL